MDQKFSWQDEWTGLKDRTLRDQETEFPDPSEYSTILTLNQLVDIDRRTTSSFSSVEEARAAFAGETGHDIYLRLSNPTIRDLEDKITLLEARHFFERIDVPELPMLLASAPVKSLAFSCGMAAISHTLHALLNSGDVMITDKILYGCSDNLINDELPRKGIKVIEIDASDLDEVKAAFEAHPESKLIYFETPANPTLVVRDIKEISGIAAKYNSLVVIDNTFATPYLQNPLRLGADIVIHSLTKYLNGHGDVLGGSVTGPSSFISKNEEGCLFYARRIYGGVMDPEQANKISKGMTSLPLRMDQHCDNAEKVVEFLKEHPAIERVYYPGLEDNRKIAEKQMRRYGGMVSFEIKGGPENTVKAMNMIPDQEVGYLAVSLGLPYTVFDYPAAMTHFFVAPEKRLEKGIGPTLVRISVGLEDSGKIIRTLANILE